ARSRACASHAARAWCSHRGAATLCSAARCGSCRSRSTRAPLSPARPRGRGGALLSDPPLGTGLGRRYRIDRLLGRGGMGRVYGAEHELLGRRVALKVLNWEIAEDHALRERFLREPRMAAEIEHPNIVSVLDVDEDDGRLYIVMELVQGSDLREILV